VTFGQEPPLTEGEVVERRLSVEACQFQRRRSHFDTAIK
jgi:hypothetical protein